MRAGAGWYLKHGRQRNSIPFFLQQMVPRQGTSTKGSGLLKASQPTVTYDGTVYGKITPDFVVI